MRSAHCIFSSSPTSSNSTASSTPACKYQLEYAQKNPDGLIIEELGRMFKEMEKGEGVVCPL